LIKFVVKRVKEDKNRREAEITSVLNNIQKDFEAVDQKKRVTVIIYETYLSELQNLRQ
jgi:hypothetical protein